jgi:AcrR family transcriptional regulator
MPRLSEEVRHKRRRHVLESAWNCFSRNGFHATSMDDVIARTGMSSSAVYRYFRSKDELIDATAEEALTLVRDLIDELLERDPTPDPLQTLEVITAEIRRRTQHPDYDMTRIAIQAWGEALRRPALEQRTRRLYLSVRDRLVVLAGRWRAEGTVAGTSDADDTAVAHTLLTLVPGLIVTRHLVVEIPASTLIRGLTALSPAG